MTSPVLRRASAQRDVLGVAALVLLVAVVLVTACGIALRVATQAGVDAGLDRSAPTDRVVVVSGNPEDADGLSSADEAVRDLLTASVSPARARVDRRTLSASYAVRGGAEGDRLTLGAYDGARDHVRLVAGDWPVPGGAGATGVVVPEAAADALDLAPGDGLTLLGQDGEPLRVEVSGVWVAEDTGEGWWAEDPFAATGVRESGGFRTFGPLLLGDVDDGGLGLLVDPRVTWVAQPALTTLSGGELRVVADRLDRLVEDGPDRLGEDLPDSQVVSRLGEVLRSLGPALSAASAAVVVPTLLLLALALTSLALAGRVVAEARAADVALRESRGFSRGQVLRESAAEMLVLGLVVLAAGPWLAPPLVRGVLAAADGSRSGVGLRIEDWLWAAVTVLVGVLLLTRAASGSARRDRVTTGWRRLLPSPRQVTEVLAVVLAVVAWQQSSGGPATDDGAVLARAAAPALVVVALLLLLARLVPLAARLGGAGVARARAIVPSVVTWELTRRAEQQRAALLTTGLAAAVTVLLSGLLASWSLSQDDQAAVTTGADVRVAGLTSEQATTVVDEVGGAVVERRSAGIGSTTGTVVVVARDDAAPVLTAPTGTAWSDLLARLAPRAGEDARVPVLVSRAVADQTGDGDRLSLRLADTSVPAEVVGVLPAFPAAVPGETAVLVDREALVARLGEVPGRAVSADDTEVWTDAPADQVARLAPGATVLDRVRVADDLRGGPVGTGLLAGAVLAVVSAAMLGVLASLSDTATTLRTRRGEIAALRAQGLSRRGLVVAVGLERGALLLGSVVLGGVVGWVTLRLLLSRLVVGDTGLVPTPAAETSVPWLLLGGGAGLAVALLVVLVLVSAARVARRPLGADLRETT